MGSGAGARWILLAFAGAALELRAPGDGAVVACAGLCSATGFAFFVESFARLGAGGAELTFFWAATGADFGEGCAVAAFLAFFSLALGNLPAVLTALAEPDRFGGLLLTALLVTRLDCALAGAFPDFFAFPLAGLVFSGLVDFPALPSPFAAFVGEDECFFVRGFGFPPFRTGAAAGVAIFFTGFVAREAIS